MVDFEKYDAENPQIWQAFVYYTVRTRAKGFQHYGAFGIINLIRWHTGIGGNDKFKVNNTYAPDYARKMEKEYPHYKGFFRTRQLTKVRAPKKPS